MPAPLLTTTASLTCSFGAAPAVLTASPGPLVLVQGQPVATVSDVVTGTHVPPFGVCSSLANPAVASATTAAQGVLTPMPCTPLLTPWKPPVALVTAGGTPVANQACTSTCAYGGAITVASPGSTTVLG